MTGLHGKWTRALVAHGHRIGREGMSKRVIQAVEEFDGSYVGAMRLAGRLKAIAKMAEADTYWSEKVDGGYQRELDDALQGAHEERVARVARQRQKRGGKSWVT